MGTASRVEVSLQEWGQPKFLRSSIASRADVQPLIGRLAQAGMLERAEVDGGVVLRARGVVGTAHGAGATIAVAPRDPSLYREMRGFVSSFANRDVGLEGLKGGGSDAFEETAAAFERAALEALSNGLPIEYRRHATITSSPSGEWDISATVAKLLVHGVRHRIVEWQAEKQPEPQLLAVMQAGLLLWRDRTGVEGQARADFEILLESIVGQTRPADVSHLDIILQEVEERFPDRMDLFRLVATVRALATEEQVVETWEGATGPITVAFVSTDRLWERVVLTVCRGAALPDLQARYHPLRGQAISLFEKGGPELDPDILLYGDSGVSCVVDAKYSRADTWDAGDVYQMFAYAHRLNAPTALLVYVGKTRGWWAEVGKSDSGVRVLACGIDAREMQLSAAATARRLKDVLTEA